MEDKRQTYETESTYETPEWVNKLFFKFGRKIRQGESIPIKKAVIIQDERTGIRIGKAQLYIDEHFADHPPPIRYIERAPNFSSFIYNEILRSPRCLILGPLGFGKTRETLETLRKLTETNYITYIITPTPNVFKSEFKDWPNIIPTRDNLAIFIDDFTNLFRDVADRQQSELFKNFKIFIEYFVKLTKDARIILTAPEESINKLDLEPFGSFLNTFKKIKLPALSKESASVFIDVLANEPSPKIKLAQEAKKILLENTDGSFYYYMITFRDFRFKGITKVTKKEAEKICSESWQNTLEIIKNRHEREMPFVKFIYQTLDLFYVAQKQPEKQIYPRNIIIDVATYLVDDSSKLNKTDTDIKKEIERSLDWLCTTDYVAIEGGLIHKKIKASDIDISRITLEDMKKLTGILVQLARKESKISTELKDFMYNFSVKLFEIFHYEEVIKITDILHRYNPEDYYNNIKYLLGNSLKELGYFEKAKTVFSKSSIMARGEIAYRMGKFDRAFTLLNSAIYSNDEPTYALINIGLLLDNIDRIDDAAKCYVIALNTYYGSTLRESFESMLIISLFNSRDNKMQKKACQILKGLENLQVVKFKSIYTNLGIMYHNLKNYPKALEYYTKRIEFHKDSAIIALSNRGFIYNVLKSYKAIEDLQEARNILEKHISRCKENFNALYTLGEVLANMGLPEESIKVFKAATKICLPKGIIKDTIENLILLSEKNPPTGINEVLIYLKKFLPVAVHNLPVLDFEKIISQLGLNKSHKNFKYKFLIS